MNSLIFNIHYASSLALLGLIWVVQLVHYPSFRFVDSNEFVEFEKRHSSSITLIVLPLMFTELITGMLLLETKSLPLYLNLGSVILIWLSTFFVSVPCHQKLSLGKDIDVISKLVNTNWIRTILWTFKFGILFWLQTHL